MEATQELPAAGRPSSIRWAWILIPCAVVAWLAPLLWVHADSPRVLLSWHGILHTAVSARFPSETLPPENPFFAGEPLGYYWAYQFLGFVVARVLWTDLLQGCHYVTLAGLVFLVVFGALAGLRCFRSTWAGLLIGYLALVGVNPLGPVIAVAKSVVKGTPWFRQFPAGAPETVFVGDRLADDYMAEPLLAALHFGSNWQYGQNIVWYLDITGRAPALGLILALLFLASRREHRWWNVVLMALTVAGITSLDPLIGLAVAGSLIGASVLVALISGQGLHGRNRFAVFERISAPLSLACLAGVVLALPTYYHILLLQESALTLNPLPLILLRATTLALNFLILAPLALAGVRRTRRWEGNVLRTAAAAGFALLLVVPFIRLKTGLGHDLTNAAQCLLALPAAAAVSECLGKLSKAGRVAVVAGLCAFLPTTVLTLSSFTGRPAVPLAFEGQTLKRLPADSPLEAAYSWIREATGRNSVFVCDPDEPVKMAGNVSELPAFTARTLFTDQESYLIDAQPDLELRAEIARAAVAGNRLTRSQQDYLRSLGRPLYLITYHADDTDLLERLTALYGGPVFHAGWVAVFNLGPRAST